MIIILTLLTLLLLLLTILCISKKPEDPDCDSRLVIVLKILYSRLHTSATVLPTAHWSQAVRPKLRKYNWNMRSCIIILVDVVMMCFAIQI